MCRALRPWRRCGRREMLRVAMEQARPPGRTVDRFMVSTSRRPAWWSLCPDFYPSFPRDRPAPTPRENIVSPRRPFRMLPATAGTHPPIPAARCSVTCRNTRSGTADMPRRTPVVQAWGNCRQARPAVWRPAVVTHRAAATYRAVRITPAGRLKTVSTRSSPLTLPTRRDCPRFSSVGIVERACVAVLTEVVDRLVANRVVDCSHVGLLRSAR